MSQLSDVKSFGWFSYSFPPLPLLLMGLPCIFRYTANHTSELIAPWEGKYRWIMQRRKSHSVQSYVAVVHFTATEMVFHSLVPLEISGMSLREEGS